MSHKIAIERDNLWTTHIWRTKLEQFKMEERKVSFNEDMLQFIISEAEKNPQLKRKSNYGGWQSRVNLYEEAVTKELQQEIYNICSKMKVTIKYLIDKFIEYSGRDKNLFDVENIGQHDGDQFGNTGDNTKLKSLGWIPQINIDEGLKRFYEAAETELGG